MADDVKKTPQDIDSKNETVPQGYVLPPHITPGKIQIGRAYKATEGAPPEGRDLGNEATGEPAHKAGQPRKPARPPRTRLRRVMVWTLAVFLSFVAVLQGLAVAGVIWLQSDDGERFIGDQLAALAAQSGYTVTYDGLDYGFPHSLDIAALTLTGADGLHVDVQNLRVRVNVLPLAARTLSVSVFADYAAVKTPAAADGASDAASQPFALPAALPDIWFWGVRFGLRVESFALDDLPVLSPDISISADLGKIVDISINARLYNNLSDDLAFVPQDVSAALTWDVAQSALTIDRGGIRNPRYRIALNGNATLSGGESDALHLEAAAEDLDLAAISGDEALEATTNLKAVLSGAPMSPSLTLDGAADIARLRAAGAGIVALHVDVPDVADITQGAASLETDYKDQKARVEAAFSVEGSTANLRAIKAALSGATVGGDLVVDWGGAVTLLRGALHMTAGDIAPLAALAAVDAAGSLDADIKFDTKDAAQVVDINANGRDLSGFDVRVARLNGAASFPDIYASFYPRSIRLDAAQISAAGETLDKLALTLSDLGDDRYDLTLDAAASRLAGLTGLTLRGDADIAGLRAATPALSEMNLALGMSGAGQQKTTLLHITGAAAMDGVDMAVKASDLDLLALGRASGFNWPPAVQGITLTDAATTLKGPLDAPVAAFSGRLAARVSVPSAEDGGAAQTQNITAQATGGYESGTWTLALDGAGDDVKTLRGTGKTTGKFALMPFALDLPPDAPVEGRLDIEAGIAALSRLVLPPDVRLDGALDLAATIGGTRANPDVTGDVTLSGGRLDYVPYDVVLSGLEAAATYDGSTLVIRNLQAQDAAQGRLTAAGRVGLANGLAPDLTLTVTDYHLLDGREIDGHIDNADLTLKTRGNDYVLGGAVKLGAFNIQIPERFRSSIPELNIVASEGDEKAAPDFARRLGLDIQVTAPGRIFVRGWGLDAEFGGDVHLGGTAADPEIEGNLSAERGRYEELGKRFTLDHANLRFLGPMPPSPYLDVKATTRAGDVDATIALGGPLNKPEMSFSSVPSLPQDEVLSRILFGTGMGRITPFQAIRLKTTFDRLTGKGGGGFDPLAELRSLTGVDDIRVDTDADGQNTVGVGKYLTDKVYLELEQGQAEASGGARIQVELIPNIQLESKIGQNSEAGGSVQWRWDY